MRQGPPLFVKWGQVGGLMGLPVKVIAMKCALVNQLLIVSDTFPADQVCLLVMVL